MNFLTATPVEIDGPRHDGKQIPVDRGGIRTLPVLANKLKFRKLVSDVRGRGERVRMTSRRLTMRTRSTAPGSLVKEPVSHSGHSCLGPVCAFQIQQNIVFTWDSALDIISSDVAMLCNNPMKEGVVHGTCACVSDLSPILHKLPLPPEKLLPQSEPKISRNPLFNIISNTISNTISSRLRTPL